MKVSPGEGRSFNLDLWDLARVSLTQMVSCISQTHADVGSSQIKNGEIASPRAHRVRVALGQGLRDLMQMIEIVNHPCGKKLPEIDCPQNRMFRFPIVVLGSEIETSQRGEACCAQLSELPKQLTYLRGFKLALLRKLTEGRKPAYLIV